VSKAEERSDEAVRLEEKLRAQGGDAGKARRARRHRGCDTFFLLDVSRLIMAQPTKNSCKNLEHGREEGESGHSFLSCFYLQLRWI
jgi:hypothetical protein